MPRVDFLAARPDADFIVATTTYQSGLPNSIPLSALTAPIGFADNIQLRFGGSTDTVFEWNTAQTKDCMLVGVSGSNNFVFTTKTRVDAPYDFTFVDSTNPRLYVTSAAAAVDEYIAFDHDGTDANIRTGKGNINLNGTIYVTSHIDMDDGDILKMGDSDELQIQYTAGSIAQIAVSSGDLVLDTAGSINLDTTDPLEILFAGDILLKIDEAAIGAFTAASDTSATDIHFSAQDGGAHVAGDPDGASIIWEPGAKGAGGAGADGKFIVRQPGGSAGVDVSAYHNGSHGFVASNTGQIYLYGTSIIMQASVYPHAQNANSLGSATSGEWKALLLGEDTTTGSVSTSGLFLGLAQEARIRYNKDATGYPASTLILGLEASGTAAKDSLAFSSATITGFANVTVDTSGEDTFIATQTAGTHSAANPRGGDLHFELGAGTGTGRAGMLFLPDNRKFGFGNTTTAPHLTIYSNGTNANYDASGLHLVRIGGATKVQVGSNYMLMNTVRIYDGNGALNLGTAAATGHSLVSGDVIVGGAMEVDGVLWADANITMADTTNLNTGSSDDDYFLIQARDNGVGYVRVGAVVSAAIPYVSFGASSDFTFTYNGLFQISDTQAIDAGTTTDDYFLIRAFDTGVGQVEVARATGAADPYFSMGGSQEFKFYNSGIASFGGTVTSTAAQTIDIAGIAATSTDGLIVTNSTAALIGETVEMGPRIRFHGSAWDTDDGVARTIDWVQEALPATGNTVSSSLLFKHSLDGGGYSIPFLISSSGGITTTNFVQTSHGITTNSDNITLRLQHRDFTGTDSAIEAVTGEMTNGDGTTFVGMLIKPKYTQGATTAAASDLVVSRWENSVGSGNQYLMDLGTTTDGTYANHTSKFHVTNSGGINMATGADLTIATGVVAYGGARMHRIVVEGGAGSGNDDLTSITGGADGDEIIIAPKTSGGADTVTVKDGATLDIAGDFAMDSTSDRMHLRHDGSAWVEISRSSNA